MGLINVGAAWLRKSRRGGDFISIKLDTYRLKQPIKDPLELMMFPVRPDWKAENEKRPDYNISVDEELVVKDDPDDIPF